MSEKIVQLNDEVIKRQFKELVRVGMEKYSTICWRPKHRSYSRQIGTN